MRYLVQFIVPALIFVGIVYLLGRRRRAQTAAGQAPESGHGSDTAAFLAILALGAAVAIGTAYAIGSFWG